MSYPQTLIVIPAYNEEKNIATVVHAVRASLDDADILVINDGSRDGTARAAREAGALVANHIFNLGYGSALQTGFKYALDGAYRYVIQVDADGQHEPSDVRGIRDALERGEADMVIGSRFLSPTTYAMSFARRAGIGLFSALASFFIKQRITDCTSGFKGYTRKVIPLLTSRFYPEDYPDADVIMIIHYAGYRIKEVGVTMHAPPDGDSMHSGFGKVFYIFKMILSILMTVIRERPRPRRKRV